MTQIKLQEEIKKWLFLQEYEQPNEKIRDYISALIKKGEEKDLTEKNIVNIFKIIFYFSRNPFLTQKEISEIISISDKELLFLNEKIRNQKEIQDIIINLSISKKYWPTIFPFTSRVESAIENKFEFPMRIALYPGVSCMFYCGFCGRNQNEKYPLNSLEQGNENFRKILNEVDSSNTAISISGGLEPLTNPKLGDIINSANDAGLRVPLITNAYSLTEKYVEKNPGLMNLDSLRVSLYGVDEQSYQFITRNLKSYKMVKKNVINFLSNRNIINPKIKVGFNYIILKENMMDVLKVLDLVNDINSEVKNGAGINFLSLRDDFGTVTGIEDKNDEDRKYHLNGLITEKDREKLINMFNEIESRRKYFPNLHIDYGYALYSLKEGVIGPSLKKISTNEMRQYGHTQMSVCMDLFGDVFLYREAGFLNRKGNDKFIIGRVDSNNTLRNVIEKFISSKGVNNTLNDVRFLDPFDHVLTSLINQSESDKNFGIPFKYGPISNREGIQKIDLGNNWYSDSI